MNRPSSPQQRAALKSAFRAALREAGGGESFAHATRVGQPHLSRYGSPDTADFPPVDVVLDLEADLGQPAVTATLAALQGFRLERETAVAAASPQSAAARIVSGAADAFRCVHEALADGRLTPRERNEVAARLSELRGMVQGLADALAAHDAGSSIGGGQ